MRAAPRSVPLLAPLLRGTQGDAGRLSPVPSLNLTRLSQRLQRCELRGAAGGLGRPVPQVGHGDEQGARHGQCRWGSPCSRLPSHCRRAVCCGEPTSSPTCLLPLLRAVPAFIQRRDEELSEADLHVEPCRHWAASPDCPEPVAAGSAGGGEGTGHQSSYGSSFGCTGPQQKAGSGSSGTELSSAAYRGRVPAQGSQGKAVCSALQAAPERCPGSSR